MSQQTHSQDSPFIDLSNEAGKRKTFRRLLLGLIATFSGSVLAGIFGTIPESIEIGLALEDEMIAPWKSTLAFILMLILLGVLVWSVYELWNFRESGLLKLLLVAFAPYFLIATTPSVVTPLSDYLTCVSNVLMGMVLLMGWSTPDIFQAQPRTQGSPVA
jgi:hypothetical protein